jgi:hypothetical protein
LQLRSFTSQFCHGALRGTRLHPLRPASLLFTPGKFNSKGGKISTNETRQPDVGHFKTATFEQHKIYSIMSLLSPQNDKNAKGKKQAPGNAQGSKFIAKPGKAATSFVKKKTNTGSRRGG